MSRSKEVNSKAVRRVGDRVGKRLRHLYSSCQDCGAAPPLVAHHVVPVLTLVSQKRGLLEEDHVLRFLCVPCHLAAHGLRQDLSGESAASNMMNLYLGGEIVRAVRLMAETYGVSNATIGRILIRFALEQGGLDEVADRQGREMTLADLPEGLVDPPEDHWIFGGRKPNVAICERSSSPLVNALRSPDDGRHPPGST